MKNLDMIQAANAALFQRMSEAVKDGKTEDFVSAWGEFAQNMQTSIMKDAQELLGVTDAAVLAQRGVRQLTAAEKTYFTDLAKAMADPNPQMAVTAITAVLPETEINSVFDYLTEKHPLLDAIDFQNTKALTKWLLSTSSGVAGWGDMTATIDSELAGAFSYVDLSMAKVSAYIPISNAWIDLGPEWLERWVRTILSEAIAVAIEAAIVDGDGKDKPLGMTRALTGATDGVYPRKVPVVLSEITPETIGALLNTISQGPNSKQREVPELILVVNPSDYYTKVYPATTVRATDGSWNRNVFPYPTKPFMSAAVPANRAVIGLPKEYFAGVGIGTQGGKIEFADQTKFLEDARVYRVKMYGNGRPKDANAFILCDITNLLPTIMRVIVDNIEETPVA